MKGLCEECKQEHQKSTGSISVRFSSCCHRMLDLPDKVDLALQVEVTLQEEVVVLEAVVEVEVVALGRSEIGWHELAGQDCRFDNACGSAFGGATASCTEDLWFLVVIDVTRSMVEPHSM